MGTLAGLVALAGAGCAADVPGQCHSSADCRPGEFCDSSRSPALCFAASDGGDGGDAGPGDGGGPGDAGDAGSDGGCTIAGGRFTEGEANPSNGCQVCRSGLDATAWSNQSDGTACSNAGGEVCRGGACTVGCAINGAAVDAGAVSPTNDCETCQPAVMPNAYSLAADLTPCASHGGNLCLSGVCQLGCAIDGGFVGQWGYRDSTQSACCNPALDAGGWTPAFGSAVVVNVGNNPVGLGMADFNGDRLDDLAVTLGSLTLGVYLSEGDGGFVAPTPISTGVSPNSLICNDLNGNGRSDVAVLSSSGAAPAVELFYSAGDGTIVDGGVLAAGSNARAFTSGPLSPGEPNSIEIVTGTALGSVVVWTNTGNSFGGTDATLAISDNPIAVALGAFRSSTANDLAVLAKSGAELDVALNTSDRFTSYVATALPLAADALTPVQFGGRTLTDLVIGGGTATDGGFVQILRSTGDGGFLVGSAFWSGTQVGYLTHFRRAGAAGDTVVGADTQTGALTVLAPAGGGLSGPTVYPLAATAASGLATGDFNGDQLTDVALSDPNSSSVYLVPGQCR